MADVVEAEPFDAPPLARARPAWRPGGWVGWLAGGRAEPAARVGRLDLGVAVALAVALAAAWPFLTRPGLPQFTDAEMHVYRAGEVLDSVRQGIWWPRWAPDFYYGYGYPVFNYYSPLTYHLAAYYALLTQTDVVAGTKAVFVGAILLGTLGLWGFVRGRWGGPAAVVACAAYALSPYLLYIDPHARGDAPEAFALGLAPLTFWAFDRLHQGARPGAAAVAALGLAGIILSHPLMALVFCAWAAAWAAWIGIVVPAARAEAGEARPQWRRLGLPALAAALALGLSALYWLPVLQERGAVQLGNVAGPGYFDFRRYFLSIAELVALPAVMDLGATEPAFHFSLGWPQVLLALLGALTAFDRRLRRVDLLFFTLSLLGLIYLMTRASLQFWELVPQMRYFQFPSRFLGPAALAAAVLAGASLRWLELRGNGRAQGLAAAAGLGALLLGALPLMVPPGWGAFGPVTPSRMIEVELDGRALGTTSANDFLPVGVLRVPDPQPAYLAGYAAGELVKFNAVALPGYASAEMIASGPTSSRIRTEAAEPFVLRLYTFYFPGWRAYVDGEAVPIEVAVPDGFITFWVPPGRHEVEVRLEDTPPRRLGQGLSAASLLALAAFVAALAWRRLPAEAAPRSLPLSLPALAAAAVVLAGFCGLKAAADRQGWFRLESSGDEVLAAQHAQFARLGGEFALLGYDLSRGGLRPGEALSVTLYWKALAPAGYNYQVYVHLIGPDGKLWGQSDKLNPADFPTSRWPADRYVRDEHRLALAAEAPAGVYSIVVGLWDAATGERLAVRDEAGVPVGEGVVLSQAVRAR
jgi:hypothetical protein